MKRLTGLPDLAYLTPLLEFRNWVLQVTNVSLNPDCRLVKDNCPRGLTLETRKRIFERLMEVQNQVRMDLISPEEKEAIIKKWAEDE